MISIYGDCYIWMRKKENDYYTCSAVIHDENKMSTWVNVVKFVLIEEEKKRFLKEIRKDVTEKGKLFKIYINNGYLGALFSMKNEETFLTLNILDFDDIIEVSKEEQNILEIIYKK